MVRADRLRSSDAEESVLGGIMIAGRESMAIVSDILTADDFASIDHQKIFAALCELDRKDSPVDAVTCMEHLRSTGQLDAAGGAKRVTEIVSNTPSTANLRAYAEIVRERSLRRALVQATQQIAADAADGDSIDEILSAAQSRVMEIGAESAGRGPVPVSSLVSGWLDKLDKRFHSEDKMAGISTGYRDLDKKTGGLEPGNLVVIAGRPSMGKTALAMNIAANVNYGTKKPVLVFSLEMSDDEILTRLVASKAKVPMERLRTGDLSDENWERVNESLQFFGQLETFIVDDSSEVGLAQIRARARRVNMRAGGLGLIVVDYVGLMRTEGDFHRAQQIGEITRGLKRLAKDLHVPVVMLAQLNREVEKRGDKRPILSDLKESGDIEQDADIVMFVYRDVVYDEGTRFPRAAEIIVAKQRNGPTGTVLMTYFGDYTQFGSMDVSAQQEFWDAKLSIKREENRRGYRAKDF